MYHNSGDRIRLLQHFKDHITDPQFHKQYGGYMLPIFVQGFFATTLSSRYAKYTFPFGCCFHNWAVDREFDWHWPVNDMRMLRQKLFEELERRREFGKEFFEQYLVAFHAFVDAAKAEEDVTPGDLSPEELVSRLLHLIEAAGRQGVGYTVDSLLTSADDDWFTTWVQRYAKKQISKVDLDVLRQPTRPSFTNVYRLRLTEAAAMLESGGDVNALVETITQDFYWIEHNYLQAVPKKPEDIFREIQSISNGSRESQKEQERFAGLSLQKKEILDRVDASQALRTFVEFTDDCAFIQDCRKEAVLRLNHFIFLYAGELARRLDFDPELIMYVMFFELEDFVKDPGPFRQMAERRRDGALSLFDKDGFVILTKDELTDIDFSPLFHDYSRVREVAGTPASVGTAQGVARIVLGGDQFKDFQDGEILITNQTTPDFLPIMRRAGGIVAEQGGLTSHAAVISRELGIPCVVGVKDAMQIFKTGETVFVDAKKGSVRKS